VWLDDERIEFSTSEFDVLWLLVEHADEVLSREDIINELRNIEYDGFNRSIDIAVSRIRKRLHDDSSKATKIKTVWGKGYMFVTGVW